MTQTVYWVIVPATDTAFSNNATDAAKIKNGQRQDGSAASWSGSEVDPETAGSVNIDEQTAATGLTAGTQYRIAATIWDGSTYGGGTSTYVVESGAFTTFTAAVAASAGSSTAQATSAATSAAVAASAGSSTARRRLSRHGGCVRSFGRPYGGRRLCGRCSHRSGHRRIHDSQHWVIDGRSSRVRGVGRAYSRLCLRNGCVHSSSHERSHRSEHRLCSWHGRCIRGIERAHNCSCRSDRRSHCSGRRALYYGHRWFCNRHSHNSGHRHGHCCGRRLCGRHSHCIGGL